MSSENQGLNIDGMTIGGLASVAGVNVETVRFYQRKGLIPEPERPAGSVRRYAQADASRIHFIKTAQKLGFSLYEIAELLKLDDGASCGQARRKAEVKLADVRVRLASLQQIEAVLSNLVTLCAASKGRVRCPMIAALSKAPPV